MSESEPPPYSTTVREGDSEALLEDARSSKSKSHIGRRPENRNRLESIGLINVFTLILGFLVSTSVATYIAFLWLASPAIGPSGLESGLWKAVALSNRVEISVTISSAVLRLAMALQVGVALSMVGGIVLENSAVPLRFVPFILTLRGSGKGSLIELVRFIFETSHLNYALNLAAATLLLTTILSQLTSTFLVADLGLSPFLSNTQFGKVAYGLRDAPSVNEDSVVYQTWQETTDDIQYWTSGAPEYPIFAEYSAPPAQWELMQDTGINLRALPPFRTSSQRAALHEYDGYTAVFDTRVTCLTPTTDVDLVVRPVEIPEWTTAQLSGYVQVDLPPHIRWNDPDIDPTLRTMRRKLNCSVSLPSLTFEGQAAPDWAVTICHLSPALVVMDSPLQTWRTPRGIFTDQYLVINATGLGKEWQRAVETPFIFTHPNTTVPWTRISDPEHDDLSISLSLCITSWRDTTIPSNIARSGITRPEPTLEWDDSTRSYRASDITRLHAGAAEGLSHEDRGVLTLRERTNWTEGYVWARKFALGSMYIRWIAGFAGMTDENIGVSVCTICEINPKSVFRAHRSHVAIFQDILQKTGSLPHAIQALFTILTQRAWYDFINEFDVFDDNAAFTLYTNTSQIPVRMMGMSLVVGVIILHNAAVYIIVLLFLNRLKISMIGNLWQGFGQVVAGDMAALVSRSTVALDKEVVQELKNNHGVGEVVELIEDSESGHVRLQRRRNAEV